MAFISCKDRKKVMPDLKAMYRPRTAEATLARLDEFEADWGARYPNNKSSPAASGDGSAAGLSTV